MISFDRLFAIVALLWICTYNGSFGVWTWKRKNRIGGVMILVVSITALVLPIYAIFFRT